MRNRKVSGEVPISLPLLPFPQLNQCARHERALLSKVSITMAPIKPTRQVMVHKNPVKDIHSIYGFLRSFGPHFPSSLALSAFSPSIIPALAPDPLYGSKGYDVLDLTTCNKVLAQLTLKDEGFGIR
jgi:hypothetical protein